SVTLNADGTLTFTPAANWNGAPSFTYTVSDGALTSTANVSGTVSAVNDAPVAAADSFTTAEDTPITFDVRSNDSDVDSASLTVTTINGTAIATGGSVAITGGSVTLNANGTLTFTPATNWNGTPSFTYTVSDGALTSTASVSGTVTAVDDAPTITLDANNSGGGLNNAGFETDHDALVSASFKPITDSDAFILDVDDVFVDKLTITLSNILDGNAEQLRIANTTFSLATSNSTTKTVGGTSFSIVYNSAIETFTITSAGGGAISTADVSTLIQGITYRDTSLAGTNGNRIFDFVVSDAAGNSNTGRAIATIGVPSTPPFIDLDPDNSRGTTGFGTAITFVEKSAPIAIADGDAEVFDTEDNITSLRVTVSSVPDDSAEIISIGGTAFNLAQSSSASVVVGGTTFSVSYNAGTSQFSISNAAGGAIADTDATAFVRSMTYQNTSVAPTATDRNVTFQVSDAFGASVQAVAKISVTPVNDAPIAAADSFTTAEDTPVTFDVRGNDSDVDSAALTVTAINGTAIVTGGYVAITGGSVTLNGNGSLTFTPNANWNGTPSFTYTVSDGALTSTANVSGTVSAVNDAPVAADDAFSTAEDTPVTFDVRGNDSDVDSASLTVTAINGSAIATGGSVAITGGNVTLNADGTLTFTPNANWNGTPSFTYTVSDGALTSTASVAGTVTAVNDAPIAADDTFTTAEDTPVTFDVRGNDSDVDSASLTITAINGTAIAAGGSVAITGGSVTLNADGTLTFTTAVNWNGTPSFTYTVSDGALTSTANVSGTVTVVNDAPIAAADSFTTAEDTAITFDVRGNDGDVDSAALTITAINGTAIASGGSVAITGGSVTLNANGTLTFTPNANWNGTPSFTYTVSDGALTSTANVSGTVTAVNDAPVAADDAFSTAEDTPVTFDVRGNDSDVDSASLTVTAINGTAIATGGSVAITGGNVTLNANGTVTFTPNANRNGTPSFAYTVSDGALTSTANVSGTVTAANDAPIAVDDAFSTAEDTPVTFDVRGNDSDVDSAALTVTAINGTAIASGGSVAITGGSVTLNANGTLTFTPNANWNGMPSFTYTVSDGALTSTANVSGTVTAVNDAPIAADDAFSTAEDTPVTFDVRGNDSDVDSAALTVTAINGTTIATGGSVAITGGNVTLNANGSLTFTPTANWNGTPSFTYTVSDGALTSTASVTGTVTAVNDAPVAAADSFTTVEDNAVTFDVRSNDSDVDSAALTVTAINGTAIATGNSVAITGGSVTLNADGTLTFTPNANWNGTPSFTYTVSDGALTSTANVSGTVTAVNDAPIAADDTFTTAEDTPVTFDVRGNDSDVDSAALTVTAINGAAIATGGSVAITGGSVTLDANGTLTFTPNANWNGTPSFTYTVSDGALTSTANVSGTVTAVNDAPVAADDAFSTAEDTPVTFDVRGNDSDVDSAALTVTAINGTAIATGNSVAITGGSITLNADGSLTFTPNSNWNGTPSFTYTVSDGALTSTANVSGTVTAVNDAPVAADDTFTTAEDTQVTFDVRGNDSDVDSAALTVTAINGTAISTGGSVAITGGSVTLNANGTLTFTPNANWNGTPSFTYTVSDGALTSTANVSGTVTAVNDAPVAAADTFSTAEDTPVTFDVRGNDSDVDSASLTVTAINGTAIAAGGSVTITGGSVTLNANGTLTFTPAANWNGTPSFTYTVSDGALTSTANVSGTVTAVNDAPVAAADTFSTSEDAPVTFDVRGNDSDVDSAALTVTAINGTAIATGNSVAITGGNVTLNADGTLTFTPNANWNGTPSFTYTVSDGALTSTASVSGTVTAVNDLTPQPVSPTQPVLPTQPASPIATPQIEMPEKTPLKPADEIQGDFLSVDGIIRHTVEELADLNSLSDGLKTTGIIVHTVNRIAYLGGSTTLDDDGPVVRSLSDGRSNLLDRQLFQTPGPIIEEAMSWSGNSLKMPIGSAIGGGPDGPQMIIETIVRNSELFVDVSHAGMTDRGLEFRVTLHDGAPIPAWLSMTSNGTLTGRPPADVETIKLRIHAVTDDGHSVARDIEVNTNSGRFAMLEQRQSSAAPHLFSDDLDEFTMITPDDILDLASAMPPSSEAAARAP
ncbi:MAG: Ig-like domain-containing protein, partial [Hyphomicrobium sp.]